MGGGWARWGMFGLALLGGLAGFRFDHRDPLRLPRSADREIRAQAEAAGGGAYSVFLPLVLRAPVAFPTDWLARLNAYRAMAGLPPVTENPTWSAGCTQHARYMVKNDTITHAEDPRNPWYTPEGDACGRNANVMVSTNAAASDAYAIDVWMQAPFHAVGILDPRLVQVGYGAYREADGGWQMGAALDVLRGWDRSAGAAFPVRWPGDGSIAPLRAFQVGEYPDPLAHCGYSRPTGLPILLLLGGNSSTSVAAHGLWRDGTPVDHCVFDGTSYTVPNDPTQQSIGRQILSSRGAVVLIPRDPLLPGSRYTVSLTVSGGTYAWSFSVAATDAPAAAAGSDREHETQIR